jgi:hypothetical protein
VLSARPPRVRAAARGSVGVKKKRCRMASPFLVHPQAANQTRLKSLLGTAWLRHDSSLDPEHIIEACRTPAASVKHGKEQAPFLRGSFGVTDVLDPRTES